MWRTLGHHRIPMDDRRALHISIGAEWPRWIITVHCDARPVNWLSLVLFDVDHLSRIRYGPFRLLADDSYEIVSNSLGVGPRVATSEPYFGCLACASTWTQPG